MTDRVLVAMSGGVDSSVAAARLVVSGLDVVGVTLHLWDYPDDDVSGRCCAPEDVRNARRVADVLGIPHYAFDRRELFRREVVDPFVEAYLAGTTPSPCVRCNRGVKISELLSLADALGAAAVATGHYARVVEVAGVPRLFAARDARKDQSYFLHMLQPAVLGRLRFPLGDATKDEVRREALALALPGAEKGESQELCFAPAGGYAEVVERLAPGRIRPGIVLDEGGRRLGEHRGIHAFTIGQRRSVGVAAGVRRYVTGLDAATATVRLGSRDDLEATSAVVREAVLADDVSLPLECDVAVRYRGTPVPARVRGRDDGRLELDLARPVVAVVPGQYAVFRQGDRVLGGGVIERALPRAARADG